jgi:NADH:ubiquinone reductase (non-electrogenic)
MSMQRGFGSLAHSVGRGPGVLLRRSRRGSTLASRAREIVSEQDRLSIFGGGLLAALTVVNPPVGAAVGGVLGAAHVADLAVNDDLDDLTALPRRLKNRLAGPREERKKVVVLGSGWGALSLLRKLDPMVFDVTIVSPRNYFFYTPMLAGVSSSTVKSHSVLEAIRQTAPMPHATYVQAECTGVDPEKRLLKCSGIGADHSNLEISYDHLVVGVGAKPNTFGIPGVQEHAMFLKELDHGLKVRQRILERLEQAEIARMAGDHDKVKQLLTMVVVGGGPTGVEFAAEIADFVHNDLKISFPHVWDKLQINLVEALPGLLPMFEDSVGTHVKKHLSNVGIKVHTETMVKQVDQSRVMLKKKSGDIETMEMGALVWVAGIGARPISKMIAAAFGQSNPRGIEVDECLRVKGSKNNDIFAIGDCAVSGFPLTAQVAAQQGKYLGRAFRDQDGSHTEPFKYAHQGALAYVGKGEAVAVLAAPKLVPESCKEFAFWRKLASCPDNWLKEENRTAVEKPQQKEISIIGLGGFAIWRGVYFTKLISYRTRYNVATDWLRSFFFGRTVASPVRKPSTRMAVSVEDI